MKFSDLIEQDSVISSWHPTKNGDVRLSTLGRGMAQEKFWWSGDCRLEGHEWTGTIRSFFRASRCPFCSGSRILTGFNDLACTNPDLASQWHPTKNGNLTPKQVSNGSSRKAWWVGNCNIEGHEWEARIVDRSTRLGCAVCSGQRFFIGVNDLGTTHPILSSEWHPTKNGDLAPEQVYKGSTKKVWWSGLCGHEWKANIKDRAVKSSGCPYCAHKTLFVGVNDALTLYPYLQDELHPTKNDESLDLSLETISSLRKVWWQCKSGHDWETSINQRRQGSGCHYCAGSLLFGFNDLTTVDPVLAAEWHPTKNGNLIAKEVTSQSNRKVWWKGPCNHEWEAVISSRYRGAGCPECNFYKTETEFRNLFNAMTDLKFIDGRVPVKWSIRKMTQIDIFNEENKICIEYDGSWSHGGKINSPSSKEECLTRDVRKTEALLAAGYVVIRIRETGLQNLPISTNGFFQISFEPKEDKRTIVRNCIDFLGL